MANHGMAWLYKVCKLSYRENNEGKKNDCSIDCIIIMKVQEHHRWHHMLKQSALYTSFIVCQWFTNADSIGSSDLAWQLTTKRGMHDTSIISTYIYIYVYYND